MTGILAWTNYAKSSGAYIWSTSEAAGLPATNVAGDIGSPSTAWQSVAGVTSASIGVQPTTTAQPWRVVGIFRTNLTSAASVTFSIWNVGAGSPVSAVTRAGPTSGYGQVVAVFPSNVTGDILHVDISDPTNPDGFINVPLLFAGPAWVPQGATSFASTVGRDDSTSEVVSRGGQEYPTLLWQRRRWNVTLDSIRASETWANADALGRYAKAGSNVLFAPDTSSAYLQQEAIFGRLKATADLSYPYQGADRRRWQFQITERL